SCADPADSRAADERPHYNHLMTRNRALVLAVAALAATAACSRSQTPAPAAESPIPASQSPTIGQLPEIDADAVMTRTRKLSSDEFEGRGPGTRGEDLTVDYLVDEFTKLGLKPGNPDGTYIQRVPLVGITPDGAPLVFKKGAQQQTLKWHDDVVAWTKHV